ncbi:hypothetical protein GGR52DRAFT_39017 [Hypoxylon sp. FL1284]|nr:hypothetical protein GGR52DRAFT_39017 [Hypoxylon sp. FL1284]
MPYWNHAPFFSQAVATHPDLNTACVTCLAINFVLPLVSLSHSVSGECLQSKKLDGPRDISTKGPTPRHYANPSVLSPYRVSFWPAFLGLSLPCI